MPTIEINDVLFTSNIYLHGLTPTNIILARVIKLFFGIDSAAIWLGKKVYFRYKETDTWKPISELEEKIHLEIPRVI